MKPALVLTFKNKEDREEYADALQQDRDVLGTDALVIDWQNTEVKQ